MNKNYLIEDKITYVVIAVIREIERELQRCYWNKYQKEINSPFANTGETYKNDVMSVEAYQWNIDDEWNANEHPNFQYKGLKIHWYKYLGRGVSITCDEELTLDYLSNMLYDCKQSIINDFEKKSN